MCMGVLPACVSATMRIPVASWRSELGDRSLGMGATMWVLGIKFESSGRAANPPGR